MRTVVAIASHQRTKPLSVVLEHIPGNWDVVVVVSDREEYEQMKDESWGAHLHLFPNEPLGAKWQHAVDKARELNPDRLIVTGSDDVLMVQEPKLDQLMSTCDMLGLRGFYAYNGRNHWWMQYKNHVEMPIGGGRVYNRAILERIRWKLFDTERSKHLDELGYANVLRHGGHPVQIGFDPGYFLVALKGDWPQKNPLDKYLRGKNLTIKPVKDVRHRVSYQW